MINKTAIYESKGDEMAIFDKFMETFETEFMSNVREEIRERVASGIPMPYDEYESLRCNSYERLLLYDILDNAAFLRLTEYCYKQSEYFEYNMFRLADSYNDALTNTLLPKLLKRFRSELENKEKKSKFSYDMEETL